MADRDKFGRESVMTRFGDLGRPAAGSPAGDAATRGAAASPNPPEEKYSVEGTIGTGGMGQVLLVQDRDLRRQIAMKVLKTELAGSDLHRRKFVAEAQATSQLEHPGIPPVHDMGVTPEGQVYFTMKLVRGRTLREILRDLFIGSKAARQEYTLHRLVTVLERMTEAVHFSHEKGVVHRDLKPENLMLGEYGEVHVMDWGIAKVQDTGEEESLREDRVETDAAGPGTQVGAVKGTIPYMSPEQASGGRVDRRTDIYALGSILYEVLTLHPAYEGEGSDILRKVRAGEFPPVEGRNPKRPVPEALAGICRAAMARDPAARPETARAFGNALRTWLDGSAESGRRHREAEDLAAKGRAAAARYEGLKATLAEAEKAAGAAAGTVKPWQPVAEKAAAIDARLRAEGMHEDMASAFAETTKYLEGALLAEPNNATARAALADLWAGRHGETERAGERRDAAHALRMLERYDDGRLASYRQGDGSLELRSDPPGAEVRLVRYEDRRGILVAGEERALGRTPTGPVPLPRGSYLCLLSLPGRPEVRYPVHISRNRAWSGTVKMRTAEEVGEGFVVVPGGPFVYGEGKDTTTLDLPDFAIQRFPVTFGDWAEFLAAVEAQKGAEEAAKWIPKPRGENALMERKGPGFYTVHPTLIEGPARERAARENGADWEMRIPVLGVSFDDAAEYCRWRALTAGREWRLPTEQEREKAARGVDGRRFPWGDLEDATLGKCRDSREERSQPEPVGSFPTARSVYGMEDAAGNLWDWTDSWFRDEKEGTRVARGGSWFNPPITLRCADRLSGDSSARVTSVGFRCARGLPKGR